MPSETLSPSPCSRQVGAMPRGYANGIIARGQRAWLPAGVVGWDANGVFADGSGGADRTQVLENILAMVWRKAALAHREHIVRMTWYVTDMEAYRASLKELGPVYRGVLGRHFPAMAVVQVVSLVEPEALVEIEATAVIA